MEFCPRTLKEALDAGPISQDHAWQVRGQACSQLRPWSCDRKQGCATCCCDAQVLRQMLAGAAYIHAQGVVHRDLKPVLPSPALLRALPLLAFPVPRASLRRRAQRWVPSSKAA